MGCAHRLDKAQMNADPDPWEEYTLDAIDRVLISLELAVEDKNGVFVWMIIWGVGLVITGIVTGVNNSASGRVDWWPLLFVPGGILTAVAGIALRINNHLELKRLARMRKVLASGRIPS